jgi:hypothetical protein
LGGQLRGQRGETLRFAAKGLKCSGDLQTPTATRLLGDSASGSVPLWPPNLEREQILPWCFLAAQSRTLIVTQDTCCRVKEFPSLDEFLTDGDSGG